MNTKYIYLHGFASGITSEKAKFFTRTFKELGQELITPDLNDNDFTNLTLSREISQTAEILAKISGDIILIGSSMGGLLATMLAESHPDKIKKIILYAPAFAISKLWDNLIDKDKLIKWQQTGTTNILHHSYNREIPLKYEFYLDIHTHETAIFKRQLPALVFHGTGDDIVPIELSRDYLKQNKLAQLIEVDDGHSLTKDLEAKWHLVKNFCGL